MEWKAKKRNHTVDVLFILLLFVVFAFTVLCVLLFGAKIYQNSVAISNSNFNARTTMLYLSNKIKQGDSADSVLVGQYGDGDALILEETYNGYVYRTYLYLYDHSLRELYVEKGFEQGAEFGSKITEAEGFCVEKTADGLFKITVLDADQKENTLLIGQRSSAAIKKGTGIDGREQ